MINKINTTEPTRNPNAGAAYNAKNVYADNPVSTRPGSELTDPNAPLAMTRAGYRSVLVKKINNDAYLRISPDGYRLITKSPRTGKYVTQGSSTTGWLYGLHSVGAMASMVANSPELESVLPKGTAKGLLKADEELPTAGAAWAAVSDFQYRAAWINDPVKQSLLNQRGW
ncbi:MAG: hypothetical protein NXH72_08975 [Hyphomonadaceae bacterium]|nr:hypothetical protein [Hyphomonadaceae bacterium]